MGTTGAVLGAAGISALGSMVSGFMSGNSNRKANKDTIAYNKWATAENQRWQQYMADNYTSYKGMTKQAREAGLNPNLLYGQGQSVTTSDPTPSFQAQPEDYSEMARGLANGAQNAYSFLTQSAQATKANAEARNIDLKTPGEVRKLYEEGNLTEAQAKTANQTISYKVQQENEAAKQALIQTTLLGLQEDSVKLDLDIKRYNLENVLPQQLANLNMSYQKDVAEIALFGAQEDLLKAHKKSVLAHIMIDWAQAIAAQTAAKASMINAQTNADKAPSEIAQNWSAAAQMDVQTEGQTIANRVNGSTAQYVIDKTAKELQKLGKDVNTYEFRNVWLPIILKSMDVGAKVGSSMMGK